MINCDGATEMDLPFKCEPGTSPNVVIVKHAQIKSGWEQWYLLRSDAHWDNPDSDWDLQKQHLEEAKQRNAGVLDFGDLFCAMQGKYDKRSNKSKVREEHQVDNYLDTLVTTAADWYQPYAHLWVAQGFGNHEGSILQRHETCLIERWAEALRQRTGAPMLTTGYTGWVAFKFHLGKTCRIQKRLWHTHGYGGGGPVTKDMIQRSRQLAYVDNADIMVSGHTHDQWVTTDMRCYLTSEGIVKQRPVKYVKCPTYKDEFKSGQGGWHVSTGKPPKPMGAYWLRFYHDREYQQTTQKTEKCIRFEIREAEA